MHGSVDFVDGVDIDFSQTFDIRASGAFVDGEIVHDGVEKIADFFHVDFEVRDTDGVLDLSRAMDENGVENLFRDSGDDALFLLIVHVTHHGVGFSGAGLAIGKDGAVVTIHDVFDGGTNGKVEDVGLLRGHAKDTIKGKWGIGLGGLELAGIVASELDDRGSAISNLDFVLWTETGNN